MSAFSPIVIERIYDAEVERVFQAWTDPKQLVRWFKGSPETVVLAAETDVRVGGSFRITVGDPGDPWVVSGTYSQVDEPNLLEFTWLWEEATMEPKETLVRVELSPVGDRTRLLLTHSGFSNETSFQAHGKGWDGVLAMLNTLFEG